MYPHLKVSERSGLTISYCRLQLAPLLVQFQMGVFLLVIFYLFSKHIYSPIIITYILKCFLTLFCLSKQLLDFSA